MIYKRLVTGGIIIIGGLAALSYFALRANDPSTIAVGEVTCSFTSSYISTFDYTGRRVVVISCGLAPPCNPEGPSNVDVVSEWQTEYYIVAGDTVDSHIYPVAYRRISVDAIPTTASEELEQYVRLWRAYWADSLHTIIALE